MKTVLIVLGIVVVLCCGGGIVSLLWIKGNVDAILAEATAFGNESTSAIATKWDRRALRERAEPSMTDADIENVCQAARERFGETTSFTGKAEVNVSSKSSTETGTSTQVPYKADLTCEKGKAVLRLILIKRGQTWKILSIDVQPG